jgi:hypothetical protein
MELRERAPDRTALPPVLVEWAKDKGYFLSLINKHDDIQSQQSFYERFAVQLEDLPEEIRDAVKRTRAFDTKAGYLQRADCYVCAQPLSAREDMERQAEMRRSAMESEEADRSTLEDIIKQTSGGVAHLVENKNQPVSAHAMPTSELLSPQQRAALKAAVDAQKKARQKQAAAD